MATGDVEGFDAFVQARAARLLRYGYALSGNRHDAADLVQEALARLGTRWSRVTSKGDPEAYVRTTMARLSISWWRRSRREQLVDAVPEQPYLDGEPPDGHVRAALWRALLALPPRQRAVLVLRYYEHCTDEEIASVLGINRSTVRSQAYHGLEKLRSGWRPAALSRGNR